MRCLLKKLSLSTSTSAILSTLIYFHQNLRLKCVKKFEKVEKKINYQDDMNVITKSYDSFSVRLYSLIEKTVKIPVFGATKVEHYTKSLFL